MKAEQLLRVSLEDRLAAKVAAQEERERIIQQAIQDGASVKYLSSRLTSDECETHIHINTDDTCIIDTTISSDITLCIKRGWKITSITYYRDTNQIAGMTFVGKSNGVSIRSIG